MFTQAELAYLLGVNCRLKIVRYERIQFLPKLPTALAYQIIFNVPAHELFPTLYKDVSGGVARRAYLLTQKLKDEPNNRQTKRKMLVLKGIIQRL